MANRIAIGLGEREQVSAIIYPADRSRRMGATVLLGHGAGADQTSEFMVFFANGLASRGLEVMTFNFLYTEHGKRTPDRTDKLESCYRAVIEVALSHEDLSNNHMIIGGKSMGGRIASQLAAGDQDIQKKLRGLVFLGYPLHPPGKPEQLRSAHLQQLRLPMLFVQGSRDAFGTPQEIKTIIDKFKLPASLFVVENGDHSFGTPKRSGITKDQIYDRVLDEIFRWVTALVG